MTPRIAFLRGPLALAVVHACGVGEPQIHAVEGRVNGIHYEVAGSGPAVVLIHGGGLDSRMWDDQFSELARTHRVVRYDVRGFGRSEAPSEPFSHVDDLASLLDLLGIESASLVGLSLGGGIALNFALVHPDRAARLLLVGPAVPGSSFGPEEPERFQRIGRLIGEGQTLEAVDEWLGSIHMAAAMANERIAARIRQIATDNHRSWQAGGPQSRPVVPPAAMRLGEIRAPTALLVGESDDRSVRQQASLVAAGVTRASIEFVPGAGHIVNLEAPEVFSRWLRRTLQGTLEAGDAELSSAQGATGLKEASYSEPAAPGCAQSVVACFP